MGVGYAVLLGLLQGLTEFLPVSSSGHLVLAQSLIPGFHQPGVLFDAMLHGGTLLAVLLYFRAEIADLAMSLNPRRPGGNRKILWWLVAATVPTGLIGLAFKDPLEALFHSPRAAASMLLVTGAVVWASHHFRRPRISLDRVGLGRALVVGVAQGIAIIPGISRSGSTIATAAALGVKGEDAARFSFLLSIPAILGAVALQLPELRAVETGALWYYGAGVAAAVLSGLWAIRFLMGTIRNGRFRWFAVYCWFVGCAYLLLGP